MYMIFILGIKMGYSKQLVESDRFASRLPAVDHLTNRVYRQAASVRTHLLGSVYTGSNCYLSVEIPNILQEQDKQHNS